MLPLDWQNVMARFPEIMRLFSSTSILLPITTCGYPLVLGFHYAYRDSRATHKWEVFRIARASLDQELVPPAVECLETLGVVHVVDQDTAVGSSVEGNAQ
jgi:hypothetical protein